MPKGSGKLEVGKLVSISLRAEEVEIVNEKLARIVAAVGNVDKKLTLFEALCKGLDSVLGDHIERMAAAYEKRQADRQAEADKAGRTAKAIRAKG